MFLQRGIEVDPVAGRAADLHPQFGRAASELAFPKALPAHIRAVWPW
jgi:hypothetical protein